MNKKITPKNIKKTWDEALRFHKRYELEDAILRLTHWVDQKPKDVAFSNDLRIVLAAANFALNKKAFVGIDCR